MNDPEPQPSKIIETTSPSSCFHLFQFPVWLTTFICGYCDSPVFCVPPEIFCYLVPTVQFIWTFSLAAISLFSSVQSVSRVRFFATPWIAARQASLSITNSWSPSKLMSIESVMPSSHLILCCPLLHLLSIFPSVRVFSNESTLRMRWPKYWSFSLSISPSNEHPGLNSLFFHWKATKRKYRHA